MLFRRTRRARGLKNPVRTPRVLRSEQLESRLLCTAQALSNDWHLLAAMGHNTSAAVGGSTKNTHDNAAPTLAKAIALAGTSNTVTGKSTGLSVLGADDQGESNLIYYWSIVAAPTGASAYFSINGTNAAKNDSLTFSKAGVYGVSVRIIDGGGRYTINSISIAVATTLSKIGLFAADTMLVPGTPFTVTGTSQKIYARGLDQFGNALSAQPAFAWSLGNSPSGAAPSLTTAYNGSQGTLTFNRAGTYTGIVSAAGERGASVSTTGTIQVVQTLGSLALTPDKASVQAGATQQFAAHGFDQFQQAMTTQPSVQWLCSGGTISSTGLFTAPAKADNYGVYAKSGTVAAGVMVHVTAAPSPTPNPIPNPSPNPNPNPNPNPSPSPTGFQDAALGSLVQSLFADGSIGRADMIQILRSVGTGSTVSSADIADLKSLLSHSTQYNMPGYVKTLAGDVVNGNVANAHYQGQALGNLAAGSSSTTLNNLIDKWFLGADHPLTTSTSIGYKTAAGSLFPATPSHGDEFQGQLGDCYLIATLGTIADRNATAIQNMFIDNGDGTFTVRFYGGNYGAYYSSDGGVSDGFATNTGTADYVTVDRSLACYSNGSLAYADYGASVTNASKSLWIPLAEKAYAQWNETGMEGRDGKNAFASIEGGWMATVDAQILGHNATDYSITAGTKAKMTAALSSGKAVTIGTMGASSLPYGLYGSHAYAVTGYNAATDLFTLYNPWGFAQPQQLTWSQIQATCSGFVVADASGSTAIAGANLHSGVSQERSSKALSAAAVDALLANEDYFSGRR